MKKTEEVKGKEAKVANEQSITTVTKKAINIIGEAFPECATVVIVATPTADGGTVLSATSNCGDKSTALVSEYITATLREQAGVHCDNRANIKEANNG